MEYLAHKAEDGRTQTVLSHLTGTAARAADLAAPFGAGELARQTGLAHDIGKFSASFQQRLLEDGPRVDHATAGACELARRGMPLAAGAVAGHHGGLPDFGSPMDTPDDTTLFGRVKRGLAGRLPPYSAWQTEVTLSPVPLPDFCGKDPFTDAFFTRMLYACLVDADYLDTEAFMDGFRPRGGGPAPADLLARLLDTLEPWLENHEGETLNGRRSAILRTCLKAAEDPACLRTLTVPTGGGKTAASLAYALAHAVRMGKRRIVYVIPYTSIIEQTADKFRIWLGNEAVLEHHSGADYTVDDKDAADPAVVRKALAAENWDAPVIVTTAVQFFESLYANRSSRCRKLHNLVNSVVVFDEAQMLPLPCLRPCVAAIAQLTQHYGVTAVLCTATQPALDPLFNECGCTLSEIVPGTEALYEAFRRVTLQHLGVLDTFALAARLNAHCQVLCIVSSRKQAQEIFALLEGEGSFHLSTLMPPVRRRAVLAEIRQRLEAGAPCRVVSTSLIEAGVDVDFPAVYRQEAGLDSILQAAGRCNREGRRPAADSLLSVFSTGTPVPPLFRPQTDAFRTVAERYADWGAPAAVSAYFKILRTYLGESAQDQSDILRLFRQGYQGRQLPFAAAAERFHLIDSPTRTIYLPLGEEGRSLAERLRMGERSRSLFRKLGQYGVSVYPKHFRALTEAGAIELLDEDAAVLQDLSLYNEATGLALKWDEGRGYFI